jgi:hypothetical protein
VRHGIFLPPFGPFGDPTALVDLAVAAEGRGWDGMGWDGMGWKKLLFITSSIDFMKNLYNFYC